MKSFFFILLSVISFRLLAAEFNPFDGAKPTAVLIQTDPWAMVIGADTPRVAIYEDGTVIFCRKSGKSASYQRKVLSEAELADLKQHLTATARLKDLKLFYNLLPQVTDQPEAQFFIRAEGCELATSVYGLKATGTKLPAFAVVPGKQKPDTVPDELLALHKYLCSLDYPESNQWTPRYLEVMIWPYEYAPGASVVWPKAWPGLDSSRSLKRGDSYSIFLDGSDLPKLQQFLTTRKENGAIKIDGRKWAASIRPVFPNEPVWRKALEHQDEK